MMIMPLVDLFATSCLWLPANVVPDKLGLMFFLIASFFNGIVIEIGRKLRQPEGEEEGVPTYSKLWGIKRASIVWGICMSVTAGFALLAASHIGFIFPVLCLLIPLLFWAFITIVKIHQTSSKRYELISGLWTLVLYLSLGLIPLFFS
jgi:4-hydroxybenzoate polyprenyltransferase